MSRQQTKATQYIQQLNDTRCDSNWDAVPELVRKVRKHAPERSCLTLTAESEYAVAQAYKHNRPSTASSTKSSSLAPLIAPLRQAIDAERIYVEDEFQARVCLGWIHWVLDEPDTAIESLPKNIDHDFSELDGTGKQSAGWTRVCAVKGAYLKGASHSKIGADPEALLAFDSGVPILSLEGSNIGPELRIWSELLLTNACLLYSKTIGLKRTRLFESETLSAFRTWAKFWESQHGPDSIPGGFGSQSTISRRYVWQKYYLMLSYLLQRGQPYPTSTFITSHVEDSTRLRQRAELEKVQATYELLLMKEVHFPKAEEASEEIEQWVDVVMQNWRVLCGSSWQESELGPGGREATSRHVLDILYRAATKTLHSTSILRNLFTVHVAVAEFDLAFKAFDTYLEIVKKGKAREEKTGETTHALDDDEIFLTTAAEAIRALCRYGSRHGAEKARDLGRYIEDWLNKHDPGNSENPQVNGNGPVVDEESLVRLSYTIPTAVFSKAWLAVGISQAQWARFTYESNARPDIQAHAIECLRKAISVQPKHSNDVETLFTLGVLLAERRELDEAIGVVKSALLPSASSDKDVGPYRGDFARERSLIPLWHLLALLLSARQEFTTAARFCEAAFEQFKDPTNLFGHAGTEGAYRSDHLNERSRRPPGVVDVMEDIEKETFLEVKITQLALIEILEGPEVAVNASDELLSLYARLFGDPNKTVSSIPPKTSMEPPPRSSAGTIRTMTGTMFRRSSKSTRRHSKTTAISEISEGNAVTPARPQTHAGPAIQVTNEAGSPARHRISSIVRDRSVNRQDKTQRSRNRSSSAGKTITPAGATSTDPSTPSSAYFTPDQRGERANSLVGIAMSPEHPYVDHGPRSRTFPTDSQGTQQIEHSGRSNGDMQQEYRPSQPPARNPAPRFPQSQQKRRRLGMLVKLWLLVAGFYRRATMLEDANGALEEARTLVEAVEADVSQDESGDVSIQDAGWGGGKSVEELWGDVWAERGHLSLAKDEPQVAQADYEAGLTNFADHPLATVGLCNILLDAYAAAFSSTVSNSPTSAPNQSSGSPDRPLARAATSDTQNTTRQSSIQPQYSQHASPLGLPITKPSSPPPTNINNVKEPSSNTTASTTALLDRLAARDRAYGLLSALTKSGRGWNDSEAWFALARACEEGGQVDRAKEALWWCIELEEARGVRAWDCVAAGGYVL